MYLNYIAFIIIYNLCKYLILLNIDSIINSIFFNFNFSFIKENHLPCMCEKYSKFSCLMDFTNKYKY